MDCRGSLPDREELSLSDCMRPEEFKIGVLRIEETGKMVLTISEDADCSGLPAIGETVCNYDEGFLAGVLTAYTGKPYDAVEVNCWAAGDRVCRFRAEVAEGR